MLNLKLVTKSRPGRAKAQGSYNGCQKQADNNGRIVAALWLQKSGSCVNMWASHLVEVMVGSRGLQLTLVQEGSSTQVCVHCILGLGSNSVFVIGGTPRL